MSNRVFDLFTGFNKSGDSLGKDKAAKQKELTFVNFFPSVFRRFTAISTANLLFAFCNIWILAVLFGTSGNFDTFVSTSANPLYAQLYGITGYQNSPVTSMLYSVVGVTSTVKVWSTASIVLICFAALALLTNGISNVGLHYLLRASVNGEYTVSASDFFGAIKKNWRQGLVFGIIDIVITLVIGYDFIAYQSNSAGSFVYQMMFYLIIAIALFYIVMRSYIYVMIVSFDFKMTKLFKNAFLLACLGFKRNLAGLIGVALWLVLNFFILIYLRGIGFLMPFIITIGLCVYTLVYSGWKVVQEYVVEPYYKEHPEERPGADDLKPEPIFNEWN